MSGFQKADKNGASGACGSGAFGHLIRDQIDHRQYVDYTHWNPVKNGWVSRVMDWPHSSFHSYVAQGIYPENWGNEIELPDFTAGE